jgi:hypothetical protein
MTQKNRNLYIIDDGDTIIREFCTKFNFESIDKNNFFKNINLYTDKTFVFRGLKYRSFIDQCEKNNIDYYYIDTGYINLSSYFIKNNNNFKPKKI